MTSGSTLGAICAHKSSFFPVKRQYLRHPARCPVPDLPLVQRNEPVIGYREGLSVLAGGSGCSSAHGWILKTA